ncbi:glycosyltransferase [bacterium]|nr:glycosyltransferase [bacterium]
MGAAAKTRHAEFGSEAYVERLVPEWKPTWPRLTITTTTALDLSGFPAGLPANVDLRVGDLSPAERKALAARHRGHICCSMAEGFGYTAAEAEDAGAFTILNSLPVYSQDYQADLSGVAFLPAALKREGIAYYDTGTADLSEALEKAIVAFAAYDEAAAKRRTAASRTRWLAFLAAWGSIANRLGKVKRPADMKHLPPRLDAADCPQISVVTLIYNRKKFFDLACHNMMITDYPKDKIEWIIVDDSDDPAEQNTDRIVATLNAAAPIRGVYVPLRKKATVAAKRNLGCEKATSDIILMMDDDDHYPETSFRRRVAWLVAHPWKPRAAAATTIACYDLQKGISAVNVPPADIPLGQRISEATLTFYKSWWAERQFPKTVVVGEAEDFVVGREESILEIPPQQVIVAFSHGRNVSSRRVPSGADVKPGCFWGFPRQFLEFIHGLAGVKVVEG